MQTRAWHDYLKPPNISPAEHKAVSAAVFAQQRDVIQKLVQILHPHSVLCLGAGHLNDIPIETLVADDADIYLAEWVDGITEQSFRHDLVTQIEQRFICLVCQCAGDPQKYCRSYRRDDGAAASPVRAQTPEDHCGNFVPADGTIPLCRNYAPAAFPQYLHADVTRGVAENFARQVAALLARAKKPKQALRSAIEVSVRPRADQPLPLADHSMDFITSSMVVSQFDFEPYSYFVRNLFLQFGELAAERNADAVNALAETLRNNLFLTQVEAHCQEILRLLKPDGRAYFSIETLHRETPAEYWFFAETATKALEIVARHFSFDLDSMPGIIVPARIEMVRGGTSIVQSYLLLPGDARPAQAA
jgi:SAM-dependent methyltransferase